jgi:CelD/BcsL family acetyltransferase involved in cellulose biosynthesis
LDDVIREIDEIARKSIKRQLGFGFFDTPQSREQLSVEATHGWLRIYVLYIEGKPVSFWKGTLYKGCLQADHSGFDSAWSAFSPGILLFLKMLEHLREEEVETIDLGCMNVQLCHCFGKVQRMQAHIQVYAPKLRAFRLNLLRTLTHYATVLIRGTRCLGWTRRVVWKIRKASALAQIARDSRSSARRRSGPYTGGQVGQNP